MTKYLFSLFFLLPFAVNAESYLCISDLTGGVFFNKGTKSWDSNSINLNDGKFLIRKYSDKVGLSDNEIMNRYIKKTFPKIAYSVSLFGEQEPRAICISGFSLKSELDCSLNSEHFKYNRKNGRFVYSQLGDYIDVGLYVDDKELHELFGVEDDSANAGFVTIGKCSKI